MISNFLYNTITRQGSGNSIVRRIAKILRQAVLHFTDPQCEMVVHGFRLQMPLSHPLPAFLVKYPQYDAALSRIASHLRQQYGSLTSIDVGANIGDTLAALNPEPGDRALAVEPFPAYRTFLETNAVRLPANVTIVGKACVERTDHAQVQIQGKNGTGVMIDDQGGSIETTTLDELVKEHPELEETRLLKIDVDGHDFSVLRGGMKFIARVKPVIFMESDVFGNVNYVDEVQNLCESLAELGYRHLVVYDHQGGLMQATSLESASALLPTLFYQISRGSLFLDLMFGTDLDEFFRKELDFFSSIARGENRKEAARIAAARWLATPPLSTKAN